MEWIGEPVNTQTIELDVSKRGPCAWCVRVAQGESGGATIKASLYDNGAELEAGGYTAFLVARLPDRSHYYRGEATLDGNVATHVCDESRLCSAPGYTDEAYFELVRGDVRVQTERFAIDILRSALEGQQPAESWDSSIDDLIARGEKAVADGESAAVAANEAVTKANEAVGIAGEAVAKVNGAADKASESADAASKAASAATAAASAAGAAADTATASSSKADASAAAANESASKADTAATAADKAAESASAAAADATEAASTCRAIYFKRATDADGNTRPVLVDTTI